MSTKRTRGIFLTVNKYQTKIILLIFIPSLLIFLSFISIVFIGNPIISMAIFHTSFSGMERLINQFSGLMIFLMCLVLWVSLMLAFVVSNNMVGAFGRINRELEEIIARRSQKSIACRSHDDLARDLLKNINVLVKYYVEHKDENKKS